MEQETPKPLSVGKKTKALTNEEFLKQVTLEINTLALSRGCRIVAIPEIQHGRIVARWEVQFLTR